jgi:hypothetical protein
MYQLLGDKLEGTFVKSWLIGAPPRHGATAPRRDRGVNAARRGDTTPLRAVLVLCLCVTRLTQKALWRCPVRVVAGVAIDQALQWQDVLTNSFKVRVPCHQMHDARAWHAVCACEK